MEVVAGTAVAVVEVDPEIVVEGVGLEIAAGVGLGIVAEAAPGIAEAAPETVGAALEIVEAGLGTAVADPKVMKLYMRRKMT